VRLPKLNIADMGKKLREPETLMLLGILLAALALRVWGIDFGLPYNYHPDERGHVIEAARMGMERTLRPATLAWPPFYAYILMGEYALELGTGLLLGTYSSLADFANQITADPSLFFLSGRLTSAFTGALTTLVVYKIGKIAYNQRVGLIAAWFLAVAFLHVRDSHYAVNDALLTFLTTLSLLGTVLIVQKKGLAYYVLAGGAAGLAFATKYTAIFVLVPMVIAHIVSLHLTRKQLSLRGLKIWPLVAGFAACAGGAILGSPYFILTPRKVFDDIVSSIYAYGQRGFEGWQIDPAGGYIFYLKSLGWGLGIGLLALCLVGVVVTLIKRAPIHLILLTFPAFLYLFMGRQEMYFARFLLPALPPLLVIAAGLIEEIAQNIKPYLRVPQPPLLFLLVMLVTVQPLGASIYNGYVLTQTDTRTLAKEWIESHLPEGSKIAVDWPHHGPPLATQADPGPGVSRIYEVWLVGGHGLSDYRLDDYRAKGYEYLIASSFIYNIPLLDAEKDTARRNFYASLDQELTLVQTFWPNTTQTEPAFIFDEVVGPAVSLWQRERPGPVLKIYRLTP